MKPSLTIGITIMLGAAAFVTGRAVRSSASAASPASPAVLATATPMVGAASPPEVLARGVDFNALFSLAAPERADPVDTRVELGPAEETPEATATRRAELDAHLTQTLGNIGADQRKRLVELNDRAVELHRRLTSELGRRTITHEEYMDRFHEEMISQMTELSGLVTGDQYRALTGLEPGVDPYEFMETGEGAAPGRVTEGPPLTAEDADPAKQRPDTTNRERAL